MNRPPPPPPNQAPPTGEKASLAGRELPADLVQQVGNLTMGQLFYILGHIQKLSAQAPVTAQALLAENPQICYALLHAECLAGMVEEPMLPMTAEELRRAKAKARQMQEEIEDHELPQCAQGQQATAAAALAAKAASAVSMASAVSKSATYSSTHRPQMLRPKASQASPYAKPAAFAPVAPQPAPPPPPMLVPGSAPAAPPPAAPSLGGGGLLESAKTEEQKQQLLQKLVQLSPEQIARLPEGTKMQLLQFLKTQSQGQ